MTFDFDSPVDRAGTWSTRWTRFGPGVIPLWVADTDFRAPPAVLEALSRRIEHGVLGYTTPPEALREAIVARMQSRYGWRVEPSWIVFLPGVVPGLHLAARRLVPPDGHALIPWPIYHHFKRALELANRAHTDLHLVLDRGRWVYDLDAVKKSVTKKTAAFFLCNPQNPGGTVFTRAELQQLAGATGDAVIVSDEIHCDLVLDSHKRHIPIASVHPELSRRTVTLMSATKAFNFPGAGCAWAIAEEPGLRLAFAAEMGAHLLPSPSVFGYAATLAAYTHGDTWLAAQIDYLRANRDYVEANIGLPMAHVEATYLAWIDCSSIHDAHERFMQHGVALSPGSQFGDGRFERLNFGTQRSRLEQALQRIKSASTPSPRG
jgi:cysteine-S-conjugate beta-lyase